MQLTILGNNSALPAYGRHPTAQLLHIHEQSFLIDCGEGTQMRLQQYGLNAMRINYIFISHLHGDHYFGLVGLISSFSLLGRTKDLHLFAPGEMKNIIEMQIPWKLSFAIHYHLMSESEDRILLNEDKFEVSCFPVNHSIPTHGFTFIEKKRKRILLPEKVKEYEIPKYFYRQLTDGLDYEDKYGNITRNEWVTQEGLLPKKYVFAADTRYDESLVKYAAECDLLYHETTYLQEQQQKAIDRLHSTSVEAAHIARLAQVKQLLIGHFSSKYKNIDPFLKEAKTVFENVQLAIEGETYTI